MDGRPECCGMPMRKTGKAESGKTRWSCKACRRRSTQPEVETDGYDPDLVSATAKRLRAARKAGIKRFVITSACNNTQVHPGFAALEKYCEEWDAALVVIPVSYKNISLYTANEQYRKRWAAEVEPYLVDERVYIGGNVEVAGDVPVQATAVNPLGGLQAIGGNRWQIVGHPQVGMKPVATPASDRPKRVYSTGACTIQSYSKTKEGRKGQFYHTYGALVVEVVSSKTAFVRQLGLHGDAFFDVAGGQMKRYTSAGSEPAGQLETLTLGDEHVRFMSPRVRKATFGDQGMVTSLRPRWIVRHDVIDGYAGSHHHQKDPLTQFRKHHSGGDDYRRELDEVVAHLNETTPDWAQTVMVASNHHDHLLRWLNETHVNKDHRNALLLAELQSAVRLAVLARQEPDPLRLYCEPRLTADVVWLGRDEPWLRRGVDHSQHGDVGANGSRGSPAVFARSTYKMTVGHSHSPSIEKGTYTVGKSTDRLEYERGLSTHWQTHCALYPDGKRTLLDIEKGGRWHL